MVASSNSTTGGAAGALSTTPANLLTAFLADAQSDERGPRLIGSNPNVVNWTHQAERTFSVSGRQALYSKIQAQAAQDAFMAFLYYSPYRYAYSNKVHGFFVYPTGNFHMENVWLSH